MTVEFCTEKDLTKMPNYFRCCRSLRDGLTGSLTMEDEEEEELVNEILEAEKRDLLDVWILTLGQEKKRKACYYSDYSDEESERE